MPPSVAGILGATWWIVWVWHTEGLSKERAHSADSGPRIYKGQSADTRDRAARPTALAHPPAAKLRSTDHAPIDASPSRRHRRVTVDAEPHAALDSDEARQPHRHRRG